MANNCLSISISNGALVRKIRKLKEIKYVDYFYLNAAVFAGDW